MKINCRSWTFSWLDFRFCRWDVSVAGLLLVWGSCKRTFRWKYQRGLPVNMNARGHCIVSCWVPALYFESSKASRKRTQSGQRNRVSHWHLSLPSLCYWSSTLRWPWSANHANKSLNAKTWWKSARTIKKYKQIMEKKIIVEI